MALQANADALSDLILTVQIAFVVLMTIFASTPFLHLWRYWQTRSSYHLAFILCIMLTVLQLILTVVIGTHKSRYTVGMILLFAQWLYLATPMAMFLSWCRSMRMTLSVVYIRVAYAACVVCALLLAASAYLGTIATTLYLSETAVQPDQSSSTNISFVSTLMLTGNICILAGEGVLYLYITILLLLLLLSKRYKSAVTPTKVRQLRLIWALFTLLLATDICTDFVSFLAASICSALYMVVTLYPRKALTGIHEPPHWGDEAAGAAKV